MNAHDAVLKAFRDACLAEPALAGGNVFVERMRKISEDATEAIVVRFGASDPSRAVLYAHPVDWESRIVVECHARNDEFDEIEGTATGALHLAVYQRVMADPTLGGVAFDVLEPVLDRQRADVDSELACLVGQYVVRHRTQARSLFAA
jgi:hypothetical protein